MKTPFPRLFMALLLVFSLLAIGAWWWNNSQNSQNQGTLMLYGNVDIREVQLAFNNRDRITSLLVEEGDRVNKGQLVARMDTRRFVQAVEAAQARLAAQEAVVAKLLAGTRPEEIRQARSEMEAAKAEYEDLEIFARRIEQLAIKELVTHQERDDARSRANAAREKFRAAQERYRLAIAGFRKEDIAEAQALLEARKAELALARKELADTSLYAPSNGVIEARLLEPGDMASPERPVYTLALSDPVWIRAYASEPDLGKLHLGMKATVRTDTFPDKAYDGWIGFLSPKAEFTPKSVETREVRTSLVYQVRVFVCNPQDELRLGMPATVEVLLDQPSSTQLSDSPTHCRSAE